MELRSIGSVLKNEAWMAFSDGGELEWIKDPALLSNLSDAYYHIRLVRQLSERYLDLAYLGRGVVPEPTLVHYRNLIDKIINGGVAAISSVLRDIKNSS